MVSSGSGVPGSDSGYILKVELTAVAGGWDVRVGRPEKTGQCPGF